jgi:hypothetical protein
LAKKRKKKLNPNRFQNQDDKGILSFDPVRRNLFVWGLIAGAAGGFFMLRQDTIIWPIVGVFAVVFIANYHINKAARRIPRFQATIISFVGVMIAMFGVIVLGTIILAFFQP